MGTDLFTFPVDTWGLLRGQARHLKLQLPVYGQGSSGVTGRLYRNKARRTGRLELGVRVLWMCGSGPCGGRGRYGPSDATASEEERSEAGLRKLSKIQNLSDFQKSRDWVPTKTPPRIRPFVIVKSCCSPVGSS